MDQGEQLCVVYVSDEQGEDEVCLGLRGELDIACTSRIEHEVLELIGDHPRLVIDLSALSFLDAAGLSLLLALDAVVRERGGDFAVRNPRPYQRRLFGYTKLDHLLEDVSATYAQPS